MRNRYRVHESGHLRQLLAKINIRQSGRIHDSVRRSQRDHLLYLSLNRLIQYQRNAESGWIVLVCRVDFVPFCDRVLDYLVAKQAGGAGYQYARETTISLSKVWRIESSW